VNLSNLKPAPRVAAQKGARGRGIGRNSADTSGKVIRDRNRVRVIRGVPVFEGGQMPLRSPDSQARLPQSDAQRIRRRECGNTQRFSGRPDSAPELMRATGVIVSCARRSNSRHGELNVALTRSGAQFQQVGEEKITKAGGKVEILL